MPLPSAIFPAAAWDGGRVIDNPVDDVTDLSSDADTDRIGGAAINRLKAEMKSVQAQLKNEFQIDFNLKEGNAIVFDADRDTYIQADADDQLGFYVGGAEVVVLDASYMGVGVEFEVFQGIYPLIKADANKNVMLGSPAAHITTDTEGFVYLNTVNGTPTGVPATTHGDSKPIVYDKVNDVLYIYNSGWQQVGSGTIAGSGTDNFVPAWTASDTLGNSAYGDDGTYGTFMEIGSSTFNDPSTLLKWRGTTVPASFTHASAGGTTILFRAQDAFAASGGDGADIVFMPGAKDGGGTDGRFIVRQPGGVAGTDEIQIYDDGSTSFVISKQPSGMFLGANGNAILLLQSAVLRGQNDTAVALGVANKRYSDLYLSGGVQWGTGSATDLTLSRDSASIFRLSTSGVTDALTFCKASGSGSAPSAYTAAADADGKHAIFRAQSGGTHTAANPNGGGFYFVPGGKGSGGSGAEGTHRVYDPGVTNYVETYHDATDGNIRASLGSVNVRTQGSGVKVFDSADTANTGIQHDLVNSVFSNSAGDIEFYAVGANYRFYDNSQVNYVEITKGTDGYVTSSTGHLYLKPGTGKEVRVHENGAGSDYLMLSHNGTNAIIEPNTGTLILVSGGTDMYFSINGLSSSTAVRLDASALTAATTRTITMPDQAINLTPGTGTFAAASHTHAAGDITSGTLALARGGTNANLSATGGASQFLKQSSAGASITVGAIAASDITSGTLAHERGGIEADISAVVKGDLIVGTGTGTFGLKNVGADGLYLKADAASPGGVTWASVSASGTMQELIFLPNAYEAPSSSYATIDTRNGHPVLDFDGTTDEEAVWTSRLPATYTSGGLTVDIYVSFTSATSGSVRFQAAIERINTSGLDIDSDSFASFQSAGGTAPGTSGHVIKVTVTFTDGAQMDSLVAGELFRLKIRRDADGTSGTDNITTDAEVLGVVISET